MDVRIVSPVFGVCLSTCESVRASSKSDVPGVPGLVQGWARHGRRQSAPLPGRSERCLVSHGAYCARMHVERAPTGAKLDTCRALPKPPSERGHLLCFRDWSKQATRVKSWNHAQQTLQGTSLVRSRRHSHSSLLPGVGHSETRCDGRLRNTARPMMSLMAAVT